MEAATITEFWIDLATNAPFVAFLLYQWHINRKDVAEYKAEIRDLRKESKEEESRIRERFEAVISDMQGDRDQLVQGLEKKIAILDGKSSSLEKGIKKLFAMLERLKEQINELRVKEEVRQIKRK